MRVRDRGRHARRLVASMRGHDWIVANIRSAPLAITGTALLLAGVLVGRVVTAAGAGSTGELALDVGFAAHRTSAFTALARAIDIAFSPGIALGLLLLCCGLVWLRQRQAASAIVLLTIAGWLSVEIGKVVVQRPRPPSATVHALVRETSPDSYPSGHTAFAAAVVFATAATLILIGRRSRVVWMVGTPLLLVVAASRLYLGAHYLADVSGSVVFAGGAILLLLALFARVVPGRATSPEGVGRE